MSQSARREAPEGGPGDLALLLPFVLNKVARRLNASLQAALQERQLSIPEWRVLATLGWTNRRRPSEIADFTAIEPSTLTRTLDRLCESGLLSRHKLPERGRALEVRLTEAGWRVLREARDAVAAQRSLVLNALGAEDGAVFLALLHRLFNVFEASGQGGPPAHS